MKTGYTLRSRSLLRVIAAVLVPAFLLQDVSFAAPDIRALDFSFTSRPPIPFHLPESVALVEDAHKGGDRTIILLQDPHTNESGQINIAKTLDIVLGKEKAIRTVFVEAGTGDESLAFLREYASPETRERAGMSFLRKGKLQGAEYHNLTSDRSFVLWGVEDKALYAKAFGAYRTIARERDKFLAYLGRVASTIKVLKPQVYNPTLLAFDAEREKYLAGEMPLTQYFDALAARAAELGVPLGRYPSFKIFKKVKKLETGIDFEKANAEQEAALGVLSPGDEKELLAAAREGRSPFKLSGEARREGKAFYAVLEEKLRAVLGDESRRQYPELAKYFRYLREAQRIEAKTLLDEEKTLELEVFAGLAANPNEAEFIRVSENFKKIKDLFNLTLSPEDFAALRRDPRSFDIEYIAGFLNRKLMDLGKNHEKAIFLEKGYNDLARTAEEFYSLTYQRDQAFLANMIKKMDAEGQERAVLIAGGYHAVNLKFLFKQAGLSYISVVPQVLHETDRKRYERLLLSQKIETQNITLANTAVRHPRDSQSHPRESGDQPLDPRIREDDTREDDTRNTIMLVQMREQPASLLQFVGFMRLFEKAAEYRLKLSQLIQRLRATGRALALEPAAPAPIAAVSAPAPIAAPAAGARVETPEAVGARSVVIEKPSDPWVVPFDEGKVDDSAGSGGKGVNIVRLRKHGVKVPDGFTVRASAFQDTLTANDAHQKIAQKPDLGDGPPARKFWKTL